MIPGYKTIATEEEKEAVLKDMLPYIKYTAYRLAWRLSPQLTIDDLLSVGVIGLLDAIERYDPSRQTNIKTYAEYRIKGAMLDELRSAEWAPKQLQKKINNLKSAYRRLEQKLERPPSEEEVAEELGIDPKELFKLLQDANGSVTISLEDIEYRVGQSGDTDYNIYEHIQDKNIDDPLTLIEKSDFKGHLLKAMDRLPEREKIILSLYYWEEITFKEIGKVLGISESRVSQLHSQALIRMRAYIEETTGD